jgi:hypothetical protein
MVVLDRPMIAEHSRVHAIHAVELAHIDQEHAAAQHVLQARARCGEDGFDVAQALLGLRFDIVRHRAGRRIARALPGDEDQPFESHARRVRPGGLGDARALDRPMAAQFFTLHFSLCQWCLSRSRDR